MIKSMTGFGRGEASDDNRTVTVEMRSVNNRYADFNLRMPRNCSFLQEDIKKVIRETVKRGKVEVFIQIESLTDDDMEIDLNSELAARYYEELLKLGETLSINDKITLEYIASRPDVIQTKPKEINEEELAETVLSAVKKASVNLDKMRGIEGEKLAEDLLMRGNLIKELRDKIEERSEVVPRMYKEKLEERIKELLDNSVEIPEERIAVETALFADKCNITEELIRLDSHIMQLKNILSDSSQPVGKKLDFLIQEMNREANTIGSKANDLDITNNMIEIKAEIEKIREQVQNIE